MAQNWVGLWLGKWVGNWLGKLTAGGPVVEKAECFFRASPVVSRIFRAICPVSRTFRKEERR